jgi:hypothetical protein
MGHPKLSNGRGQAELIFVTQEGHHAIRALPPDSRDQKAAHPGFRCVASTEGFLGQQLWRLCGSEPTPGDGGGAYLPFIIERSRLAIDRQYVEFVCVDPRLGEDRGGDESSKYDAAPIEPKGSMA